MINKHKENSQSSHSVPETGVRSERSHHELYSNFIYWLQKTRKLNIDYENAYKGKVVC